MATTKGMVAKVKEAVSAFFAPDKATKSPTRAAPGKKAARTKAGKAAAKKAKAVNAKVRKSPAKKAAAGRGSNAGNAAKTS